MRSRLKQVVTAAIVAALTVTGLAVATGGGGGNKNSSDSADAPTSFAANGNGNGKRERHFRGDVADADVRAVLKDIRDAVAKQAPDIAGPVIDKAEQDGKITAAQADKLRQAAQDIADGKRPDIRDLGDDADVREVVKKAFAAVHEKAPGIAEPIIAKAVDDKKITAAQADQIKEMVQHKGPGPGLHKRGGHGPGGKPRIADEDVRAVLEDVHAAVAKQAPDITGPVIDKAESDGKITAAQADKLRDVAKLPNGKDPGFRKPDLDLRDADVREVLKDAFEAIAAKTRAIAKPIVDKAVKDGKITKAQGEQITNMQRGFKLGFHHRGHHRGDGPGKAPPPPGFERPAAPPVPESSSS